MTSILIWVFPILLLISVPVAFAMIGSSGIVLLLDGKSLAVIAQRLYTPTPEFPDARNTVLYSGGKPDDVGQVR